MELALARVPILQNIKTVTQQTVRHKGFPRYNRLNWRPIPPKTRRDSFYKVHEPKEWHSPILAYKKSLDAKSDEPLPPPSPMHVVTRCKSLRGQTRVCKMVCEHFGIGQKMHNPVVIPNSQSNNEMLMEIKHLIRIKPLSTPDGLPQTDSDSWNTQLRTDGSLHIIKSLQPAEEGAKPTRLMTGHTIAGAARKKLDSYGILQEYYKTKYVWRYNEDKKEYPYKPRVGS